MKWFEEGAPVCEASKEFIAEENPKLEDYPVLFIAIQEYELSPFVGRRIKYIHSSNKLDRLHRARQFLSCARSSARSATSTT